MTATVTEQAPAVATLQPVTRPGFRDMTEWAAYGSWVVLLLWRVLPGAWDADVLPVAIAAAVPGVLLVRPWRHLRTRVLVLCALPGASALVVVALAPYGDGGVISLSRWVYAGLLTLGVASFARSPARRATVLVTAVVVSGYVFSQAWLPWWGHGDTAHPMLGSFYSANPFGSAMLGGFLVSAGTALLRPGPVARAGYGLAPLCACGVVFSGSRAALLLAVLGGLVLVGVGLRLRGPRTLLRAAVVAASAVAAFALLTSPIFFPDGRGGSAAGSKVSAGQTVSSTSSVRLTYWRGAWSEFLDEPLVGGGSGSYFPYSRLHAPAGVERSTLAHNEPLGALAEGGLAHGLPVLAFFAFTGWRCTRVLADRRYGDICAAAVAGGALLVHGLLDIGLAFPGLLGVLALLLGPVLALTDPPAAPVGGRRRAWPAGAALVLLGILGTYVAAGHARVDRETRAAQPSDVAPFVGLRDARAVLAELRAGVRATALPTDEARRVLRLSEPLARFDGGVQGDRITLMQRNGDTAAARAAAVLLAAESRALAPRFLTPLAGLLPPDAAADLLAYEVYTRAVPEAPLLDQLAELALAVRDLAGADSLPARCAAARFPSGAAVKGKRLTPEGSTEPTIASCDAWSRAAAGAWEAATR